MSFADDLRKTTADAQHTYSEKLKSEQAAKDAADTAKRIADTAAAQAIIAGAKGKCQVAAAERQRSAMIMKLPHYGRDAEIFKDQGNVATRANMSLKAGLVFDYLEAEGLLPVIKFNHDGVGIESWYELHATW